MDVSVPGSSPLPSELATWHELECGRYRADLPLWRALARESLSSGATEPILDVGAGTGRVALELARAGHAVTAVEPATELADVLEERRQGLPVTVLRGDARKLSAGLGSHRLAIVAMQTIQLFGGRTGRARFLSAVRPLLTAGGVLACAIIERLDPFDVARGDAAPPPDSGRVGGLLYTSQPVRVRSGRRSTVIERERSVDSAARPAGTGAPSLHADVIDLLSAEQLEREGRQAGFEPMRRRAVPATAEHVGSVVVMLGA